MQILKPIYSIGKAIKRRLKLLTQINSNRIFRKVTGVIHVGANTGQEIQLYAKYGLSVVWIEPIPDVFRKLQSNLAGIRGQIAIKGLVTDHDDVEYNFHLANNNGASSSIMELNLHKDIWPDVIFQETIYLRSKTLPSLLALNQIDPSEYDMLAIDTQGSELLVLKGAMPILDNFRYIKTEVPDFEAYKGCCQLKDLQSFLGSYGYSEISRHQFASHPGGGNYFDIIFKRQ